ncbi:MAG TPA: HAD-IIB family hydrolase [Spirochaetota bacterium]|nr:HAD-IIB family hydrolase [Spirochaetota bacterium]HPI87779.1 HAD-IIB family hydrolase [Spirochaetota bacterium]HPR47045.1 HAD-IIB family hydrolase [Spirochaetota bacterium]
MENRGLYVQMFSIHGLLRKENMEMGRDADTGGQIKYVVELAETLSGNPDIARVDLFTRLIADKSVSEDYSRPVEDINDKFRIVRIQCGGRKYMRKELLWQHLDEYIDKTIKFIKRENFIPHVVHGHYADGGYVAMQISEIFGIPFAFTGHSLGRSKLAKLIGDGMREDEIIKKYKINTRIEKEEDILKNVELVVTSTNQEKEDQYGMYENSGLPRYAVIPPGLDVNKFYAYYHDLMPERKKEEEEIHAHARVLQELNRFFIQPDKPLVLTLCRPDKRKNISGLIEAYGEDKDLQIMANLAIFAGIRKDIHEKEENERDVLTEMLLLMDKYDLYGKMAIPKKHDFDLEVPELYRIAAAKKGVFVNAALTEPFGLTLLEASSCGLPIVTTNDGGPRDIIANCENGILVDPTDGKAIARAIKKIITNPELWERYSKNGVINVQKHYTWDAHVNTHIPLIKKMASSAGTSRLTANNREISAGARLMKLEYFLITDIDNTLIGDDNDELEQLLDFLKKNREHCGFAVATGRTVQSALDYLEEHNVPVPDIIISSVGSEIYYGNNRLYDSGWDAHLSHRWERQKIVDVLKPIPFLEYQEEETQRKFKISYFMDPKKDRLSKVHHVLMTSRCHYSLIYSHERFLDILPYRASKGKAIRFVSYKWEIPLENILVCGDSGNDEEMLTGEPLGVVVGNYSSELELLRGNRNIYFAEKSCAGGILQGIDYYRFEDKFRGAGNE